MPGCDFHTRNDLHSIATPGSPLTRVQCRERLIVIGNRDHSQIGVLLDVIHQRMRRHQTVRREGVQVQIRQAVTRLSTEHHMAV